LFIIGIPSPGPFPDCIGTEYSLLEEGEEKIRITSSSPFDKLRAGSNPFFSFAIGEEGGPDGRVSAETGAQHPKQTEAK